MIIPKNTKYEIIKVFLTATEILPRGLSRSVEKVKKVLKRMRYSSASTRAVASVSKGVFG